MTTVKSQQISEKMIHLLDESIVSFNIREKSNYQMLSDLIGDARIVLMGEATHGTFEFYQTRMELSKLLIQEKGFQAIAIEGDWTKVYQLHRYCQGYEKKEDATKAFKAFDVFPKWMWCNTAMLQFIREIRQYNDSCKNVSDKVGLYGLDLYCLNESVRAVIDYFQKHEPNIAKKALEYYECFDHAHVHSQNYAFSIQNELKKSCLHNVTMQLMDTYRFIYSQIRKETDFFEKEEQFYVTQNARVVKNAENYYRSLVDGSDITWNIRDRHMADTLQNIISHLESCIQKPAKVIVWAHNSHLGDARATEMSEQQHEVNLGQLVRERFNTNSFSLGFSTSVGEVTAANNWGAKTEYKLINEPITGSYEWFFHRLKEKNFLLDLRQENHLIHLLKSSQLQRAIGVIYRPETERMSHYFFSRLAYQFDALIHFDETNKLKQLDENDTIKNVELPETYPKGF